MSIIHAEQFDTTKMYFKRTNERANDRQKKTREENASLDRTICTREVQVQYNLDQIC